MMRTLVVVMLAFATAAAAQSGPAPGYEDGLTYARDHAGRTVEEAAADPVGYAGGKDAEAVAEEAGHAAYMACWIADDAVGSVPACDAFYTPPVEVEPDIPAEEVAQNVTDELPVLANEVMQAAEDLVEDPTDAPAVLERLVHGLLSSASALAALVLAAVQGIVDGLAAVGASTADIAQAGTAAAAAGDALAGAATATRDAVTDAARGASDAVTAAVAGGLDAVADVATSGRDAMADAARAVSEAARDAAAAVRAQFADWFEPDSVDVDAPAPVPAVEPDAELVEGLLGILP